MKHMPSKCVTFHFQGGHNSEQQRQMPAQELAMHVTQGIAQGVSPFNAIGPAFSHQTASPVQTYLAHSQQQHQISQRQSHASNNPHHHPQLQGTNHGTGSQQQQIYLRMAGRELQQQYMQQQQQYAASNNLTPHVQSPSQLPTSSSLQNSQHIQAQPVSQSAPLPPLTSSPMIPMASQQHQQKNQLPTHNHGLPRTPETTVGSLSDQVGPKQRQPQAQQQQFQQSGRAHPQQRQQPQPPQQQAKFFKGNARGNISVHPKLPMDPSHSNGLSTAPGSMGTEKEMMQHGQGVYSGMGINQVQPSKGTIPQAPNHSQLPSSSAASHPTKQHPQQQMPSHSENNMQGQFSAIPPVHNTSSAPLQSQQNQRSQTQTVAKRMMHPQNRQHMNHEQLQVKSQPTKAQASGQKLVNIMSSQAGVGAAAPVDSSIKMAVATSPVPQGKSSEAAITSMSAQVGPMGSTTLPTSLRSEQVSSVSQGAPGQRHLADNLPNHGLSGGSAHGALARQSSGPLPSSSQKHFLPQS